MQNITYSYVSLPKKMSQLFLYVFSQNPRAVKRLMAFNLYYSDGWVGYKVNLHDFV